jgi:hypothetical protein
MIQDSQQEQGILIHIDLLRSYRGVLTRALSRESYRRGAK